MKQLKIIVRWLFYILILPISYFLVALILSAIPVNNKQAIDKHFSIYLNSNGVHLDIIIPKENMSEDLLKDLLIEENTKFCAFGWGEQQFYLNTPTWGDLTFKNFCNALFVPSAALMHLKRYTKKADTWVEVPVTKSQLQMLNQNILNGFKRTKNQDKLWVNHPGYSNTDEFYYATGSYHLFNTCNSWANAILKKSSIKACLWTPFDFSVLNKHQ